MWKIGHKGADCFTLIRNKDKKEAYLNKNSRYKNKGRGGRNRNFKRESYSRNQESEDGEKALTEVNQELLLVATADKKFDKEHLDCRFRFVRPYGEPPRGFHQSQDQELLHSSYWK